MELDFRVATFYDEHESSEGEFDELEWGQSQRIVFSLTNPSNSSVIRLDNITA